MDDPHLELRLRDESDKQRKVSDERYAIKLVEKIVFGAIGLGAVAVLGAILNLVIL